MKLIVLAHMLIICSAVFTQAQPPIPQTTPATPTATPTPTPTPKIDPEIDKAEQKIKTSQEETQAKLDVTNQEIATLKTQIDALIKNPSPDLKEFLNKTNQRLDKLEKFDKESKEGEQKLDHLRYEAGETILLGLIRDSGKLKVAISLSNSLTGYQNLANPVANPAFAQELETLKAKLRGSNKEGVIEKLTNNGGGSLSALTANPYISVALSLGSFFYTKFNSTEKPLDKINNIACVIDYTSRTAPDLKFIQLSLNNLDTKVRSFQEKTKLRFRDYSTAVGYDRSWEDYVVDVKAGRTPLKSGANTFFTVLENDVNVQAKLAKGETPENLATLRFQIENVKDFLNEYEMLLKDVDDFYTSFISMTKTSLDATSSIASCNTTLLDQSKASMKTVFDYATQSRNDFRDEYTVTFLTPSKRVLYSNK